MKIQVGDGGRLELSEINTIIELKSSDDSVMKLTVRDGDFEIMYGENRYSSNGSDLVKL